MPRQACLVAGSRLRSPLARTGRPGPVVAARQGAQPGCQLQQAERFYQVVVGASVEAADPIADRVSRRQHEDRDPAPLTAQPAAELHAIKARQHQVQHDRRVLGLGRHPQAVGPVSSDVDGMPLFLEAALDEAGHPGLVLDHQYAHTPRLRSLRCATRVRSM